MQKSNGHNVAVGHREDKGVSLYVRTQLTGYVDVGMELRPGVSQEEFTSAWHKGEIFFNGPSLEIGDEGTLILNDEEIGRYDTVDLSYDLYPWDKDPDHDMIISCAPF